MPRSSSKDGPKRRAAIIGAGLMGRWHAEYLCRVGGRVVAIYDVDRSAAERLAKRHRGAEIFDATAPIESGSVDVVHVCAPASSHAAWVEKALRGGCDVVVEKPLATGIDDTEHLLQLAGDRRRQLVPVHQFPFQRGVQQLLGGRHRLGNLLGVTFAAYTAGAVGLPAGPRRRVLLELLPHPLSLLHRLWQVARPGNEPPQPESWRLERADDSSLCLRSHHEGIDCRIELDLDRRPTRNEWVLDGSAGRGRADLYHGYGVLFPGTVSRRHKILLPLRESATTLFATGTNLVRRALLRRPAYPGLFELIQAAYLPSDEPVISAAEIRLVAASLDRISGLF